MFKFFKKDSKKDDKEIKNDFEIDLISSVLAYEIARSDGDVKKEELSKEDIDQGR